MFCLSTKTLSFSPKTWGIPERNILSEDQNAFLSNWTEVCRRKKTPRITKSLGGSSVAWRHQKRLCSRPAFSNHLSLASSRLEGKAQMERDGYLILVHQLLERFSLNFIRLLRVVITPSESSKRLETIAWNSGQERLPFVRKFPSNCTGIFLGGHRKQERVVPFTNTGKFFAFSRRDLKPGTGNPNKWYRKFRSFR